MSRKNRVLCWLCNGTGKAKVTSKDVLLGPELPGACITIIRETAKDHGLTMADIVGRGREARVVEARYEAAYRMQYELSMTLTAIGAALGGRNHSTIIHGLRRVEAA